jgi:hypothetical protein
MVPYRHPAHLRRPGVGGRFGGWKAAHTRFTRWAKAGVWERFFKHLPEDADNEYAMIDSTIVPAHQHSAGAQKEPAKTKRSAAAKGGLSTKINATVDALGNPTGFTLTPGQACDLDGADIDDLELLHS